MEQLLDTFRIKASIYRNVPIATEDSFSWSHQNMGSLLTCVKSIRQARNTADQGTASRPVNSICSAKTWTWAVQIMSKSIGYHGIHRQLDLK